MTALTITAAQAESLAEHGLFVVDGDPLTEFDSPVVQFVPPAVWVDADQPCPTCDGDKMVRVHQRHAGVWSRFCPDCHGTGRKVVRLLTPWVEHVGNQTQSGNHSLGVFTIQVLPITEDGYDELITPDKWGVNWDDDGFIAIGLPGQSTIFYTDAGSAEKVTLPPNTKPGQFAIIATEVKP